MISDITLGQFFPGKSVIHRLDPRAKILLSIIFIVAVFFANNPVGFAFMLIWSVLLVLLSGISLKVILKGLKPILFIVILTAILNLFMTNGDGEPLLEFWVFKIYTDGIMRAVFMAVRVLLLIVGTSVLLTYTTSPIALTDGLESLLSPLKHIKVPVHTFAMMMSIALRFIPTLVEETEKIMNAQKSRGADFSNGSLVKRAKALIPILIPLFVSSFKRAEELATAMECRCYRGDKNRVKMVKLKYQARDFLWLFMSAAFLTIVVCLSVMPYGFELEGVAFDILFYKI
jgi:energy-coupling factor transport system permease protein